MNYENNAPFPSPNRQSPPDGFAKSSRILGFLSVGSGIASAMFPFFAPLPLMFGMLSIVFGIVSKKQAGFFHSYAITGIVCSSVTLAFMLVIATFLLLFFNTAGGQQLIAELIEQYNQMLEAYSEFYGN